jgi:hypothetical protein
MGSKKYIIGCKMFNKSDKTRVSHICVIINAFMESGNNKKNDYNEMKQEALFSIQSLKKKTQKNKGQTVYSLPMYLMDDDELIGQNRYFLEQLINNISFSFENACFYLVAHANYESFNCHSTNIGLMRDSGFSPCALAEKFVNILGDNIANLRCITFLTCHSAEHRLDYSKSYAGLFAQAMHTLGAKNLIVSGYLGYYSERRNHKCGQVSREKDTEAKVSASSQEVTFYPDGSISFPSEPLYSKFKSSNIVYQPQNLLLKKKISDTHELIGSNYCQYKPSVFKQDKFLDNFDKELNALLEQRHHLNCYAFDL